MALKFSTGLKNKLLGKTVDLVTNGVFDSDVSGWTQTACTATSEAGGPSGNAVKVTNNSAAAGHISQQITVKEGHAYLIEVYHKNGDTTGYIKVGTAVDDGSLVNTTIDASDWALHRFYVVATGTTLYITLGVGSSVDTEYTNFDEVKCLWLADSIEEIFKNSKISIFTGTQPSDADQAPTGTKLVDITTAGSGNFDLIFAEAEDGCITKKLDATWSGPAVADGVAGWFRLLTQGDSEDVSTEDCRIDGAIAESDAELVMPDTNITNTSVQTISTFKLTIDL